MFQGKVVVITGGAQGIGRCIASEFEKQGATVCIIDRQPNAGYVGDISSEQVLRDFSEKVISMYGRVDCLINNAIPLSKGLDSCTYDEFNYALRVGITAPFFLTQLFMPYFAEGASIVNISSSRDRMSQPDTESYTAAKGGIAALTHAMAVTLAGRVRVNSIYTRSRVHFIYGIHRRRRAAASGRQGGKPSGYRQYGAVPLLGQSRIYHRGKYLH